MKIRPFIFGNKPDFIIIGAQKGGTSSLFYYLSQHSQIQLPSSKEIHFFDNNYGKGIKWYRKQFPGKFIRLKITGEASPYYLFHPLVPQRVFSYCPNAKFIVMLRNPVDRAFSHFMMQKKRGIEPLTFEEAVHAESFRINDEENKIKNNPEYRSINHQQLSYLARGMYYSQIKRWLNYFPKEQFLFIKSESFFNNTQKELNRIYNFLRIRQEVPFSFTPVNTNTYEEMNTKTRNYLTEYFEEENNHLTTLLDKKIEWVD